MSNNLTIPAAVWEHQVDGVPLVAGIVEGVLVHPESPSFGPRGALPEFDEPEMRPPADLVALRDARCETCGGDGVGGRCYVGAEAHCDDCDGSGRLLVDVRVEMIPYSYHGDPCPCGLPADEHYRTVKGLVDVELIADVIHDDDGTTWLRTPGHNRFADRPAHRLTPGHVDALGTIRPGQWAWTFTEVEA